MVSFDILMFVKNGMKLYVSPNDMLLDFEQRRKNPNVAENVNTSTFVSDITIREPPADTITSLEVSIAAVPTTRKGKEKVLDPF